MLNKTFSYLVSLSSVLYQTLSPCVFPELLPTNSTNIHQYLGKWYFKAAVSHNEAEIQQFREMDSVLFSIEDTGNATLLLTGRMRIGNHCINQTWTYRMHPGRDDLELEGRPHRRNLLWSGRWANCSECITFQEVEPPLNETGTEDSLNRFMLYSRKSDLDADLVTAFQKNAACNNMTAFVKLPQDKGCCRGGGCLEQSKGSFPP